MVNIMDEKEKLELTKYFHMNRGAKSKAFDMWSERKVELINAGSNNDNEIEIYSLIVPDSEVGIYRDWFGDEAVISGRMFRNKMKDMNGDVTLRINSDGGDAFEASTIVQCIQERQKEGYKVNTIVDGMAASAASLVTTVCNDVMMSALGHIMIHCGSTFMYGNSDDLKKAADFLGGLDKSAAKLYSKKTGKTVDSMLEYMKVETYLTAEESVEIGFADSIMENKDDPDEKVKQQSESFVKMRDKRIVALIATI